MGRRLATAGLATAGLALFAGLTGCTEGHPSTPAAATARHAVHPGTSAKDCNARPQWLDADQAPASVDLAVASVGLLHLDNDRVCSGALIGPQSFLTAGHCVAPNAPLFVEFQHQTVDGLPRPAAERPRFAVAKVVDALDDDSYDYAILELEGTPGLTQGHLSFHPRSPRTGEPLAILHHPGGQPLVISEGTVLTVSSTRYTHDADTIGGSSGAPVLDQAGTVIGIHTGGACEGDANGNVAHRSDAIRDRSATLAGTLPLAEGFRRDPTGARPPRVSLAGDTVALAGRIHSTDGTWVPGDLLGLLPEDHRPDAVLSVLLNQHHTSARVELRPSGEIVYVAGSSAYTWLSLDGVEFARQTGTPLALAPGAGPADTAHRAPSATVDGDQLTLSGRVRSRSGSWQPGDTIAVLPADQRPSDRLVFAVSQGASTARVDVSVDGRVRWWAGAADAAELSLEGIRFALQAERALVLDEAKTAAGGAFRAPAATTAGSQVRLSGLVVDTDDTWTPGERIATLPASQRPAAAHSFNLSQHDRSARVDVMPDGSVVFEAGDRELDWLSLDGIVFSTPDPR